MAISIHQHYFESDRLVIMWNEISHICKTIWKEINPDNTIEYLVIEVHLKHTNRDYNFKKEDAEKILLAYKDWIGD